MKKLNWILGIVILSAWVLHPGKIGQNEPAQLPILPKNIILLIGDGMGLSQISAAIYNNGNAAIFEEFPVVGFQKTHASDNLVTDSAASATAMACGKKTFNNAIGVDADGKPCTTILEKAENKGLATGLVATSSITHATPAAFMAHQPSRNYSDEIASDMVKTEIDFIVGGGKQYFDRREKDDRNLLLEFNKKGYDVYDYFNSDILNVVPALNRNFFFLTADNQPLAAMQGRTYLPRVTKMALNYLRKKSEKGFFIMIEGSQIDWGGHANNKDYILQEIEDFSETIEETLAFAKKNGETLVIVTGDHETGGFAINPGSQVKKLNVEFTTNGHTASMIPVFAFGPGAETFRGIYDNTEINKKMCEALRLD